MSARYTLPYDYNVYLHVAGMGWGVKIQNTYSTVLINFIFTPKGACLKRNVSLTTPSNEQKMCGGKSCHGKSYL